MQFKMIWKVDEISDVVGTSCDCMLPLCDRMGPFCDRRLGRNLSSRFFCAQNSSGSKKCKHAIVVWPKSAKMVSYIIKKARDMFTSKPVIAGCIHVIAGALFLLLDI